MKLIDGFSELKRNIKFCTVNFAGGVCYQNVAKIGVLNDCRPHDWMSAPVYVC